jgi:hypothetical protein
VCFSEINDTRNRQGHRISFKQVPKEVFASLFPGAAEAAEMFSSEHEEFNNRAPFAGRFRSLSLCESLIFAAHL